jgi:hypothetical protein
MNATSRFGRIGRVLALTLLLAMRSLVATAQTYEPARPFHLGFTPFPPAYSDTARDIAYAYIREHGDLISHTFQGGVPWPEALQSADWRTYPPGLLAEWSAIAARDAAFLPGHARYISIHPINGSYDGLAPYWGSSESMPLPSPWTTYGFDQPEVAQAFLNYAAATIDYFHPQYLGISVEANILLARRPEAWIAYKTMIQQVHASLKARYPQVIIFVSIQYEHMLGLQFESKNLQTLLKDVYPDVLQNEVRDLLHGSDALVLSTYPYMALDAVLTATYYDPAISMGELAGKPLAIEQTGYTSQSVQVYFSTLAGTEDIQNIFTGFLLDKAYRNQFLFVVNFLAIDYGLNYGADPVQLTWAYTGLWRPDGSAKPAANTWQAFLALPFMRQATP